MHPFYPSTAIMDLTNLRESLESSGNPLHDASRRAHDDRLTNEFRGLYCDKQRLTQWRHFS